MANVHDLLTLIVPFPSMMTRTVRTKASSDAGDCTEALSMYAHQSAVPIWNETNFSHKGSLRTKVS